MVYTRVTNKSLNDNIIQNLLQNRTKLNTIQEQISSGKLVSKPSDEPSAVMSILSSGTSINKSNTYINNIDSATSELDVADKAILSAIEIVHRANELTVKAANTTSGPDELNAISYEIEQLLQQTKDLANTKFGDKYIFSGLVTETSAYTTDADGGIKYNGTPQDQNYQREVETGDGIRVSINLPGDKVFGQSYVSDPGHPEIVTGSGLIQTLTELQKQLKSTTPDYDAIRSKITDLDSNLSTLLDSQAELGGTMSRLDMTKTKLEDNVITYTKMKSGLEDIDLAKSISDLQYQQTALDASLSVSAKVIQKSLLDYISI